MLNTILVVVVSLAGVTLVAGIVIKLFYRERYRHMKLLLGLNDKGEDE